jgi:hypothetical protein
MIRLFYPIYTVVDTGDKLFTAGSDIAAANFSPMSLPLVGTLIACHHMYIENKAVKETIYENMSLWQMSSIQYNSA